MGRTGTAAYRVARKSLGVSESNYIKWVVRGGLKEYGIPDEKIDESDPAFIRICERVNHLTAKGHSYGGAFEIAVSEIRGGGENPNYDEMFKA